MKKKPTAFPQSDPVPTVVEFPATASIDRRATEWLRGKHPAADLVWSRLYRLLPAASRARQFEICFELAVLATLEARKLRRVLPARALSLRQCLLEMLIDPAEHRSAFSDLRLTTASAAALFGEPLREL